MRRLALALVMALLLSSAASAQFREDIEIKLVEIDVVVTDKDGHHIHGLKKEDFIVLESGALRKITNFTEYAPEESSSSMKTGGAG